VTNPDEKMVAYAYDALARRASMTDPDDGRFTYAYDATSRLT
jgi:YD repeat-containing protein